MTVTIRGLQQGEAAILNAVKKASKQVMIDNMTDLERVASETAPLDEGDLEMGGSHSVVVSGDKFIGQVRFQAWNNNPNRSYDFNYAIKMHEDNYNLGKKSQQKAGGSGNSGKSYPVGRKYLTRPLQGEAPYYRKQIKQAVKDALKDA